DANDVGLQAVAIALIRRRQPNPALQPLGVGSGEPLALLQQLRQPAELWDADGAKDVRQPVVETRCTNVEVAARLDAMVAKPADRVGDLALVRRHRSALAGGDDLARVEGETAQPPEPAARPPGPSGPQSAGRVL